MFGKDNHLLGLVAVRFCSLLMSSWVLGLLGLVYGQNLDFLQNSASGVSRGLAGAGIAGMHRHDSGDLNPAVLAGLTRLEVSISAFGSYYVYQLINERKEEQLTRIFNWTKLHPQFKNLQVSGPAGAHIGLGVGIQNQITPFLYNQKRALTWSPLFNQTCSGSLGRAFGTVGYLVTPVLALGFSVFHVSGTLVSEIHGENHGNDTEKWALLENRFRGNGLKLGSRYGTESFNLGFTFEPPQHLSVYIDKSTSPDSLYAGLLPDGTETRWKTPGQFGLGGAYLYHDQLMLALDIVYYRYSPASVQFNRFEDGGNPVWDDLVALRLGLERINNTGGLPLRCGYAYLPQAYTSTRKTPGVGQPAVIEAGHHNLQQLFTVGTSTPFGQSVLNVSLEYAVLTWHGDLYSYIQVEDSYTERVFTLFLEWVYSSS